MRENGTDSIIINYLTSGCLGTVNQRKGLALNPKIFDESQVPSFPNWKTWHAEERIQMLWCIMLCEWYWISIIKCTAKGWRLLWRMPLLQITTLLASHLRIKPAVLIETGTQNAVSAGFATIADSTSGKKWGLTYVAGSMRIHKIEVKYHNLVGFPVSTLILLLHAILQYPNPIKQELQWWVEFQAATDETHWTCRSNWAADPTSIKTATMSTQQRVT